MKQILHRTIKTLTRSDFSARGDAVRAESRAAVARDCDEGRAWDGIRKNTALLGMKTDSASRPKVMFGASH